MELRNKVALITGGARMGEAIGVKLAARGCHVVYSYRSSRKKAQDSAALVARFGVRSSVVRGDMGRDADVRRVVANIKREFGRLDILVNMTSGYEETPYDKIRLSDWERNIQSNLRAAFLTVLHAAPLLRKKEGRVIHFSDWSAASGRPRYKNFLPYYAAKSGILGLTQAQALELAPRVLVNAIAPGPILPPANLKSKEAREVARMTPLGKWGGPGEIAKGVLFLCETDFVTGECLRIDGGRHLY